MQTQDKLALRNELISKGYIIPNTRTEVLTRECVECGDKYDQLKGWTTPLCANCTEHNPGPPRR